MLDGEEVPCINSRLKGRPERKAPTRLQANSGTAFLGCKIAGQGFILTPAEAGAYCSAEAKNSDRIFKYIGGQDLNQKPDQTTDRLVVDFAQMTLEEAAAWPALLELVRERVKPYRDSARRDSWRKYWWRFGEVYPAMRRAIAGMKHCLVTARVTKHLCFSFVATDHIVSESANVIALDSFDAFSVLQSRIHQCWARLLSSSLRTDMRYSVADCFETFPFPTPDPRSVSSSLQAPGEALYTARTEYMVATHQGLTQTYNQLLDPTCADPDVTRLRALHEELDRAVLAAYREHAGWPEIDVPPYGTPTTDAERRALEAFEDEVIDRLFLLNAERAAEEAKGAPKKKRKGKKRHANKKKPENTTKQAQAGPELFDA